MNVGVAHSEANPNGTWMSGRGGWLSYGLAVLVIHLVFRVQPWLTGRVVWTLTNVAHAGVQLGLLHTLKGAPWHNNDQGRCRRLTHWEQIDAGQQMTGTKKFLTLVPILLFLLSSHASDYQPLHFLANLAALALTLLPKLPSFHKVRILDINKY